MRRTTKRFKALSRIKDIFHGEHRKFAWYVVFSTTLFLVFWIVGPGNTFIHWADAGLEKHRQEREIQEYKHQIQEMESRIDMMKHNRDTLEKFAREQYYFAEPGEDVYLLESGVGRRRD